MLVPVGSGAAATGDAAATAEGDGTVLAATPGDGCGDSLLATPIGPVLGDAAAAGVGGAAGATVGAAGGALLQAATAGTTSARISKRPARLCNGNSSSTARGTAWERRL